VRSDSKSLVFEKDEEARERGIARGKGGNKAVRRKKKHNFCATA
jgi:hypothetical protein